jgi:hypothetical protein
VQSWPAGSPARGYRHPPPERERARKEGKEGKGRGSVSACSSCWRNGSDEEEDNEQDSMFSVKLMHSYPALETLLPLRGTAQAVWANGQAPRDRACISDRRFRVEAVTAAHRKLVPPAAVRAIEERGEMRGLTSADWITSEKKGREEKRWTDSFRPGTRCILRCRLDRVRTGLGVQLVKQREEEATGTRRRC